MSRSLEGVARPRRSPWLAGLAAVLLATLAAVAAAVEDKALAVPRLESVERALEALKDAPADDAQAARLKELYSATAKSLRAAAVDREDAGRFERLYADAPARTARFVAELQEIQRADQTPSVSASMGVARLERRLDETEASLSSLRSEELSLGNTVASLQARVEASRAELKALGDVAAQRDAAPAPRPGESAELGRARVDEWSARQDARAALRQRLETEVRTLPARLSAVQAELKLVGARREQAERALGALLGLEHLRRIAEASKIRDETADQVAALGSAVPEIRALAQEVVALSEEYVEIVTRFESGSSDIARAMRALEDLRSSSTATRQQLEIAALSDSLGPVLVEQYLLLEGFEQPDRELAALSALLSDTRLREFRLGQLRDQAGSYRERLESVLSSTLGADPRALQASSREAEGLLARRDELLDALGTTYVQLTGQIIQLDAVYQDQQQLASEFRRLLERNLIWMKSHRALGPADFLAWPAQVVASFAAEDWGALLREARASAVERPLGAILSAVVLLAWWRYHAALRNRLSRLGLRSVGWRNYRFHMALQALGIHLLLALPVPVLLLWASWLLEGMEDAGPLAATLGEAARSVGLLSYGYLFLLGVLGPEGFARQHLRWKTARVQAVERLLRTGLRVLLPMAFLSSVISGLDADAIGALEARIASLVQAAVFFVFLVLVARAGRGMTRGAFFARQSTGLERAARVVGMAVLAAQPLIVVLELLGYHFTAEALEHRVFLTIVLLAVTKLVVDTGLLGLTIAGQRSIAARDSEAAGEEAAEEALDEIDLEKMNANAVALLKATAIGLAAVALLALWAQFFAALSILDTVTLWQSESTVDGKTVAESVSLFDLLGALLVFAVALVIARGLPALLGIVLYSVVTRKGVLFAIQTVISYAAVAIGVFAAFQFLGFGWSKLQWMAAGLSVGLGFGLQEIFANFFAGLIMLFERPVRIGDVITLGEYSGTIQRIRMRATTITDFDNREIIVPNKAFVTERLINWTLSSSVVRMSFDVGVSYVADPRLVRQTLLDVLAEDPRVMKEPAPNVVFREFGPSSLNFRCFAHVEDLNLRWQVQNDLHMRITEVFRELGIEIAYPQMDLHVRSVDTPAKGAAKGG